MVFAILFIGAFLAGVIIYFFTRQWLIAVVVPMLLFALNAVVDPGEAGSLLFTLVFGLTIVFFASLLGAYVVQTRTAEVSESEDSEDR